MDQDLVVRATNGDQLALESLMVTSHPRLFRVAFGVLRDRHLAEDATQQAFPAIWRDIRRRDPSRFEAWSNKLLVRICYAEATKQRDWLTDDESQAPISCAPRISTARSSTETSWDGAFATCRQSIARSSSFAACSICRPIKPPRLWVSLRAPSVLGSAGPPRPCAPRWRPTHEPRHLRKFGRGLLDERRTDASGSRLLAEGKRHGSTRRPPKRPPSHGPHAPGPSARPLVAAAHRRPNVRHADHGPDHSLPDQAHPFGQQGAGVPGAHNGERIATPIEFTGRWNFGSYERSETLEVGDGVSTNYGGVWSPGTREMSEPSFDGKVRAFPNSSVYRGGVRISNQAFRIQNDDGAWQGEPAVGLDFADAGLLTNVPFVSVFHGEGAYAGLTAIVEFAVAGHGWDLRGVIIDGDLPPEPEPVPFE